MRAALMLEDGNVFYGQAFGAERESFCRTIFYTGMTGFTQTITDSALAGQAVVFTYPLVGNTGVCYEDFSSPEPSAGALIVSEISETTSNFRCEDTLPAVLKRFGIPGVTGVDTRFLVRHLRAKGALRALVTCDESRFSGAGLEKTMAEMAGWSSPDPVSLIRSRDGTINPGGNVTIALLDTGARRDTIDRLCSRGARVRAYGHAAAAGEILAGRPDGVLLAGGPDGLWNDPELVQTARGLLSSGLPMLALCQGHLLLAAAAGAAVESLPRGHRGANYAVRHLATGAVCITSQNHGSAVSARLPEGCSATHVNVDDRSVAGLEYRGGARSFSFDPGACAGAPWMTAEIDRFFERMGA